MKSVHRFAFRCFPIVAVLVVVGCEPQPPDLKLVDSGVKKDAAAPKLDSGVAADTAAKYDVAVSQPDVGPQEDAPMEPDAGPTADAAETPDTGPTPDAPENADASQADAEPASDAMESDAMESDATTAADAMESDATTAADAMLSDGPVEPTSCMSNGDCARGVCVTGTCRASTGLLLYWSFDDPDGAMTVSDSSGNGHDGAYVAGGDGSYPAFTSAFPTAIKFNDQGCRSYDLNQRHAAQLVNMPQAIRVSNNYSLSAWFRVKDMTVDPAGTGSEIMSGGDQYSMRAASTFVQMSKRTLKFDASGVPSVPASGSHIQVKYNTMAHLDGNWHHLAGVATPNGMKLYMDGVLVATLAPTATDPRAGSDVRYDRSNDFWVARHGGNGGNYDFHGDIDDVRLYNHAMTDSDVAWLASGKP